jgi:hypothetical protein
MTRAQAQYLRIYEGSTTYERWQSYYVNNSVSWQSQVWDYQPFEAEGITSGNVESESTLVVTLPALPNVIEAVLRAVARGRLVELTMYEFYPLYGNNAPQASQTLVAAYTGEVVGVEGTFTTLSIQLGSSLAPVGAQVPPRKYSTRLVGVPCRL